jgi:hypothetical protein
MRLLVGQINVAGPLAVQLYMSSMISHLPPEGQNALLWSCLINGVTLRYQHFQRPVPEFEVEIATVTHLHQTSHTAYLFTQVSGIRCDTADEKTSRGKVQLLGLIRRPKDGCEILGTIGESLRMELPLTATTKT